MILITKRKIKGKEKIFRGRYLRIDYTIYFLYNIMPIFILKEIYR